MFNSERIKMKQIFTLCLLFTVLQISVCAQTIEVNLRHADKIEFIGLHEWTPQRFLDRILHSCNDSTCYRDGEFKVGCNSCYYQFPEFPSINALTKSLENGQKLIVLSIIEPQFKDSIKYIDLPKDTLGIYEKYKYFYTSFREKGISFQAGLISYLNYLRIGQSALDSIQIEFRGIDTTYIKNFWKELSNLKDEKAYQDAIYILQNDANFINRLAAVCILFNFYDREETYHLILDLINIKHPKVSIVARYLLNSDLAKGINFNIHKQKNTLSSLLNGANVGNFRFLLKFLSNISNLSDSDIGFIFDRGKRIMIDYLRSDSYSKETLKSIEKITQKNFNNDVSACIAYLQAVND